MSSLLEPSSGTEIRDRDIELLRGLLESRIMTLSHAAALHFDGRKEAAKKRVQKLKAAGLIGERPRRARDPSILHLTAKGIAILGDRGVISNYPNFSRPYLEKRARVADSTLRHELQVMDVKTAMVTAIRKADGLHLETFNTWPLLNEFIANHPDGERVTVKPDGFLQFLEHAPDGEKFKYTFFLEVDRGSEVQERLANHASCYRDYYRSGGFAESCGGSRGDPTEHPFRVLFVFHTAERRNNAAERMLMLAEPIGSQAYLTTVAEVTQNPLGEIWMTPKRYREKTQGTAFDVERRRNLMGYSRSIEREKLVELGAHKLSLLE
jgi:hypothetical protein